MSAILGPWRTLVNDFTLPVVGFVTPDPRLLAMQQLRQHDGVRHAAGWVMDMAKIRGFDFITPADAEAIATLTDPVRALLVKTRPWLETIAPTPWPPLAG